MPGFLWILPHAPFPFAGFALHLFTVINHSHKYDSRLSPGRPPRESSNLGAVLGTLGPLLPNNLSFMKEVLY